MRYTIMGFSQRRMLDLGLGMDEAMILRWMVDYQSAGTIRTMTVDGKEWLWINYAGVLADIPIVAGSVRTITRRFERLVEAGVLTHLTLKDGGTYSCFRFVESVYLTLLDDRGNEPVDQGGSVKKSPPEAGAEAGDGAADLSGGMTELADGLTEMADGVGQNWQRGSDRNGRPKDTYTNKTHTLDKTLKRERARFARPDVAEISRYCTERGNRVDPQGFFDFYESKGWMVGSSPMRDWRAAVRTWERKDGGQAPLAGTDGNAGMLFRMGRVNEAWAGSTTREVEL